MENGDLGIAYVSRGNNYMDAVAPDMTPGAINLESVDDYLESHFGTGKKAQREVDEFFNALGFVRADTCPWPLPKEPSTPLKDWEATSETGSILTDLSMFFGEHVRFSADVAARTFAIWTLRSSIPESATHAPPLVVRGTPRTGKSRA